MAGELSPEEVIAGEIIEAVVERIRQMPDPLGRVVVGNVLSKQLMPAVYEQMMADAAEFREDGGTWVEIGDRLGVTGDGARQRLDPDARQRNVERSRRARRGHTPSDPEE